MTHRRDEIEKFCRNFLHGNSGHQQLHELAANYECEFSQINVQQLFTKDTFDCSFQSKCNGVFTHRHAMDTLSLYLVLQRQYTNIIALLCGTL